MIGDDQARERGVAHGVADEREALEDDERAHHRADDADEQRRDEAALHEAVGQRIEEQPIESISRPLVVEVALAARRLVVVVGVVEDERAAVVGQDEDVAAVRLGQQLLVEDEVLGRTGRDDPAVDQRGLVEALRGADQVVGRGDDRLAGPRLGLEDVHQVLLGRGVDAGDRLVEQVQVGLGGDRPGQEDAPALAAGQRADLAVDGVGHADRLERRGDALAVGRGRARARCRAAA